MSDSEQEIRNQLFSRRQALKIFGAGSIAGIGAVVGPVAIPEVQNMLPTPESRLESNNLGEFIPLYRSAVDFGSKYGTLPPLFQNLQNILISVAQGNSNSAEQDLLEQYTAEWGTNRDELPQAAQAAFEQLEYEFDPNLSMREQMRIKTIAQSVAQTFPMLAIAAAKTVHYGDSIEKVCKREAILGCTDGETFVHAGNKGETSYGEVLIHEWNHDFLDDFDKDPKNFQYISKQEVSQYFTRLVTMLDRFYSTVASDTSDVATDYMFGYNNWDERVAARQIATGCMEILGMQPSSDVEAANSTVLSDSPQYNQILRQSLRKVLFEKNTLTDSEFRRLTSLIDTEMQFMMHVLHYPALRKKIINTSNENSITQQFLDLTSEHQKQWVSLASSGEIQGTKSMADIRELCGLSRETVYFATQEGQEMPQMFDYEEFGCTKRAEGFISEGIWQEIHELPQSTVDKDNIYLAWEFYDPIYSDSAGNHILLFAVPKTVDTNNLKVSFENDVASITFSNGQKIEAPLQIKEENNSKKIVLNPITGNNNTVVSQQLSIAEESQDTGIKNELGAVTQIYKKQKQINKRLEWTSASVGDVGPLEKAMPSTNVSCVLTSDPRENYAIFYASGDAKPQDDISKNIALLGDVAALIPTESGYNLMFRALPEELITGINRARSVDETVQLVNVYNSELIGGDHFVKKYSGQTIHPVLVPHYQSTSDGSNGIVYSVTVGDEGRIRMYQLEGRYQEIKNDQ